VVPQAWIYVEACGIKCGTELGLSGAASIAGSLVRGIRQFPLDLRFVVAGPLTGGMQLPWESAFRLCSSTSPCRLAYEYFDRIVEGNRVSTPGVFGDGGLALGMSASVEALH